jgi:hypothetical protein
MSGTAIISACGKYRYKLTRGQSDARTMHWIMLNPSTADALEDDPTIRRCVGFARHWGFDAISVHNLFAVRATSPYDMKQANDPVGPDNHDYIVAMCDRASTLREPVVCGWGNHGSYMDQANTVLGWLDVSIHPKYVLHFGKTIADQPLHPLYLPSDTPLQRMDGKPQVKFTRR